MVRKKKRVNRDEMGTRRRLGLEPLEPRQLLAGDLCEMASPVAESGQDSGQAVEEFLPAKLETQNLRASDAAGSSLSTAADLGVVSGTIQRHGRLGFFDRIDVIRFEVPHDADFSATLDHLTRNADLYLLDEHGDVLAGSRNSGRLADQVSTTLSAGQSYYLAITGNSFRTIRYRITLNAELLPPPAQPTPSPATESPADPSDSAPVSEPIEPGVVQPLADVANYGGTRDWNINAVGAPEAWAAGYEGQGVTVAVIDTGVDLDHPDLVSNLFVNPGEIAGNGIDDDGNGFVDDVSGYDFVSRDSRADDTNGHGTHVAGTIAAAKNGYGATGIAPAAKILPVRVLDSNGSGTDFNVAAGIRYAAAMGADIINLSLGGGYSSLIASAIQYATSLGSLVVAAAGNESASLPSYPARMSSQSNSLLSVGAYDSQNRIAGFSNDVGRSGSVQIDAPGVGVFSTYTGGRYSSLSGTSMASPHVAGVAALTLSANPDLTSAELRTLLAKATEGQAIGSDAIGKVSAAHTVAYAMAGLSPAGIGNTASVRSATTQSTRVRATTGVPANSPPEFGFVNVAGENDKNTNEEFSPEALLRFKDPIFVRSTPIDASQAYSDVIAPTEILDDTESQEGKSDFDISERLADAALDAAQWWI